MHSIARQKDCTRRFVLLKLTTDRHEASRGLFATAELLVFIPLPLDASITGSLSEYCRMEILE